MIQVVCVRNPFDPLGSREIRKVHSGLQIRELVRGFNVLPGYDIAVSIDGRVLTGLEKMEHVPSAGSCVVFCAIPQGGGGGKNPLAIVAMIAVMIAAPYAGGFLASAYYGAGITMAEAMAFSTTTAAIASVGYAGAIVAGGMLVSSVFPVSNPSMSGPAALDNSPTYSWDTKTNAVMEGAVLPELFGTHRIAPPLIGHYIETQGSEKQVLNMLFAVAGHQVDSISGVHVNDTAVESIPSILIETRPGTPDQQVVQYFNDTRSDIPVNGKLTTSEWITKSTVSNAITGFGFTIGFPTGLCRARQDGTFDLYEVRVYIEYSVTGSGTWTPLTVRNMTEEIVTTAHWSGGFWDASEGQYAGMWIELEHWDGTGDEPEENQQYESNIWIHDPEQNTDYRRILVWHKVEDTTIIVAGSEDRNYYSFKARETHPQHFYFYRDGFPSNQYDVRMKLVSELEQSLYVKGDAYFETLTELTSDDFRYPGTALLAVRAVANEQLSGTMPRVDCLVTRSTVPVWQGSSYVQFPANNPAWVCYHLLHQARYKGTGDTSLAASYDIFGVPADRIDFWSFVAWAGWCQTPGGSLLPHTCNIYFDSSYSLRRALDVAGTCGRGSVVQIGSKFTVIVDRPEITPVQRFLLTPGNIAAGSFSETFLPMQDRANSIEVTYFDASQDYSRQIVEICASDFDTTDRETNKASITLLGVTTRQKAIDYARFLLNSNRYLTNTIAIDAGVDAIACIPGDVIEVAHDVPQWGYGGRVVSAGTNLLLYSEQFDNAYWTKESAITITPNDAVAPDGTTTADKMVYAGSGNQFLFRSGVLTGSAGFLANRTFTVSIYARVSSGTETLSLYIGSEPSSDYISTPVTVTTEWQRFTFTRTFASDNIGEYLLALYLGNLTKTYYVWGAQMEESATATPYIPTTDAVASGITLDRPVTITGGTTYHIMVKHQDDDSREEKTVTTGAGTHTTLAISGTWAKIPALHAIYSFGEVDHVCKEFRVLRIGHSQDMNRKITAIEYLQEVFEDGATIPEPESPSDLLFTSNLVATEVYRGGAETRVYLTWRGIASFWNVFMRKEGAAWALYSEAYKPRMEVPGLDYGVLYEFAVTHTEDPADGQTVQITLRGKIDGPGRVPSLTATQSGYSMLVEWDAVDDFDLWGYELRVEKLPDPIPDMYQSYWIKATRLFKGNAQSYTWVYESAGNYCLHVCAIDAFGNLSNDSTKLRVFIDAPSVTNPTRLFSGPNVILSWNAPVNPAFAVDHYNITYGNTYDPNAAFVTTKSTTFSINVTWGGLRRYWIVAVDVAGNKGAEASVDVDVLFPNAVGALTPRVIDNNVLLYWNDPTQGSLPVAYYEVSKGDAYLDPSTVDIGTVLGTFTTIFEEAAGSFVYWIVPVDTAGNHGPEKGIPAYVNQPPDYILLTSWVDDFSGTPDSAVVDSGMLFAPIDISETYEGHFTGHSYTTPQAQIDDEFPVWVMPVPTTATYTRVFDYGGTINPTTKITLEVSRDETKEWGNVTIAPSIEVSADGNTWETAVEEWSTLAASFRYVRIILTFTGSGGDDIAVISSLLLKLDLKEKTIGGSGTAVWDDAGGTEVSLLDAYSNPIFVDVRSIMVTPKGSGVIIPVYDFVDTPSPTHFHVYLFDAAGVRLDGEFSWMVRGV